METLTNEITNYIKAEIMDSFTEGVKPDQELLSDITEKLIEQLMGTKEAAKSTLLAFVESDRLEMEDYIAGSLDEVIDQELTSDIEDIFHTQVEKIESSYDNY